MADGASEEFSLRTYMTRSCAVTAAGSLNASLGSVSVITLIDGKRYAANKPAGRARGFHQKTDRELNQQRDTVQPSSFSRTFALASVNARGDIVH